MTDKHVIAVDLGAESGRVIKVRFDGKRFNLEEIHRFPNIPVKVMGTLHWDALRLWYEIKTGIEQASNGASSVGLDTWGVDFALLDRDGRLLANPVHYRDSRTEGMMEWVFERVPRRTVFERTGIQFMTLNTLYQLASLACERSPVLEGAATFLMIPDLFNYWLSGMRCCEFTDATTTQFYNPRTGDWDWETLKALGLPETIFPRIVQPGTRLGEFHGIPVIAPACHDTGSAVVAVPTTTADYAYCSSGTWSLFGLEVDEAVINDAAYEGNVTNEGGANGTFRLLKNVAGMWLAQQCRATWRDQGTDFSYEQLTAEAKSAQPFRSLVDPDDPIFLPPGDMPARIRDFCRRTGQPEPENVGQVMRTVYESLALKYRVTLETLTGITGRVVERLHVIGGGSQNTLLNQMTADALGRPVIAGPAEATALGNAVIQLIALGELSSVAEARQILSTTVGTEHFEPQQPALWEDAYGRYRELLNSL
jgi:rhamnulokinase